MAMPANDLPPEAVADPIDRDTCIAVALPTKPSPALSAGML